MTRFTIRHAGEEDAALVADLGARSFSETFASVNTPEDMAAYLATSFSPEIQTREMQESGATFLVAEREGAPVGYAHLQAGTRAVGVTADRPIEIVRIYVLGAWHGTGAGAALMRACVDLARAGNHDAIWLGVWEHNDRAVAFYRKWGFAVVGKKEFRLGSDMQTDFVMARRVDER